MLKRWIWILIPLAVAGAVFSWRLTHPGPETKSARLTVMETQREIANLPHYVAAGQGYFRDAGLNVTLGTAPRGVLSKEDTARADLILTPFDRILDGGGTAVAVLTHTEPALLLAREKSAPFTWTQLEDKTVIGENPAGTGEIAMENILRAHELIPQSGYVSIQHLPPHLRLGTYLAGTGEYIILTDPEAARMEKSGRGHIVSDLTAAGHMPSRVVATPTGKPTPNGQAVHRYTEAIARAQVWIAAHSAEQTAVAAAPWFPWISCETMVEVITRAKEADLWPPDPTVEQTLYDRFQELLMEAGELPGPIPYEKMVDKK